MLSFSSFAWIHCHYTRQADGSLKKEWCRVEEYNGAGKVVVVKYLTDKPIKVSLNEAKIPENEKIDLSVLRDRPIPEFIGRIEEELELLKE